GYACDRGLRREDAVSVYRDAEQIRRGSRAVQPQSGRAEAAARCSGEGDDVGSIGSISTPSLRASALGTRGVCTRPAAFGRGCVNTHFPRRVGSLTVELGAISLLKMPLRG